MATAGNPRRPLLAGASGALGVLVGGVLGAHGGFYVGLARSTPPTAGDAFARMLEAGRSMVEALPYVLFGAFLGAVLAWLVLPSLLGAALKWPQVWAALGVQVVAGIALWLAGTFIATRLDVGVIGGWVIVVVVIMVPPAAGRWIAERDHPQTVRTDDGPRSNPDPS